MMILTTVGPSLLLGLLLASAANSVDAFSSHVAGRSAARSPTALLMASHRSASCFGEETASTSASTSIDRRSAISNSMMGAAAASVLTLVGFVPTAQAGIDPNALKALPTEGDTSGAASRLKQIEAIKTNPVTTDAPFEQLPSGVSYGDFREGKGDAIVQAGSKVAVEMTIRCKSFSTANEPGGVKYFSTKDDTDFNEVGFTVGSGEILPGLEEGMMGMKKGGIRRIEVPSTMVFAAKKEGQLPLPSEKNKDGKRRFEQLFKTDATLLFEVLVTRIK